jgi:hypothetical protein
MWIAIQIFFWVFVYGLFGAVNWHFYEYALDVDDEMGLTTTSLFWPLGLPIGISFWLVRRGWEYIEGKYDL